MSIEQMIKGKIKKNQQQQSFKKEKVIRNTPYGTKKHSHMYIFFS